MTHSHLNLAQSRHRAGLDHPAKQMGTLSKRVRVPGRRARSSPEYTQPDRSDSGSIRACLTGGRAQSISLRCMSTPGDPTTRAPGTQPPKDAPEWTRQVTDLVTDSVDKVRSRTTGPLMGAAHGIIYGIVAAIVTIPVMVVLFVGMIRFLNWAIPGDVWIVYTIIALVLWIAGWISWGRRGRVEPAV